MEEDLATVLATHYYAAHGDTVNVEVAVKKMIFVVFEFSAKISIDHQ